MTTSAPATRTVITAGRQPAPATSFEHRVRIEEIIAAARTFLAVSALTAVWLDPTEPTRLAPLSYGLLVFFTVYSVAVFAVVGRVRPAWGPSLAVPLHVVDFAWASLISFLTEGPNSPFFVFFVFILLESAYRWGLAATLLNGILGPLVLIGQAYLVVWLPGFAEHDIDLNRLIVRSSHLLTVAVLVGYLSEQARHLRTDAASIARLVSLVSPGEGFRASLKNVLLEVVQAVGARQALVVLEEADTGRLYLIQASALALMAPNPMRVRRLRAASRPLYFFEGPAGADGFRLTRRGPAAWAVGIDASGRPLQRRLQMAGAALPDDRWNVLECVSLALGAKWSGRLLVLDPASGDRESRRLVFLQSVARQVAPALYSLYLMERLHRRAGEFARGEVARQLHDGVIQSLVGLEMQLGVLLRDRSRSPADVTEHLERVHRLLRQEVLNVRALMHQLRPPTVDPTRLIAHLQEQVERFRRQTGIQATLQCTVDEVTLPPRICRELSLIVREALANVQKHSGARSVVVRLEPGRLLIADDGRGFEFDGRLSGRELDAFGFGPAAIRESVRTIGGDLTIESTRGGGTRLCIDFPETLRWSGLLA